MVNGRIVSDQSFDIKTQQEIRKNQKMKLKRSISTGIFLHSIFCWTALGKSIAKDEEIEVKLQFLEYELEDFCVSKNEAEWKFLSGVDHDLKKYLDVEMNESEFFKRELELLQKHMGKKFSDERLQRLVDIFSHPGAPLLGTMEFKEYREYSTKLQELTEKMKISCTENDAISLINKNSSRSNSSNSNDTCTSTDVQKMNKFLYSEKNEEKLKNMWIKWYRTLEEKNKKTKYDFVQQLTILDLEAEQNGEEELAEYWLKQTDSTWVNYETAKNLWKEIQPLYEKLKNFILFLTTQKFGKGFLDNQKIIPAHILGSLIAHDWITAAEKLGAFDTSEVYKLLQQSLKKFRVEDLYKMVDNQTAELKLGYLPHNFYEKSRFNTSSQTCQHKMMDYCERENAHRAMFCANEVLSVKHYVQVNENVMKLKYRLLSGTEEEENGYLFREGPRESALYEAMKGLASLRALRPENLENEELVTNQKPKQKQQNTMLSLLITAFHVIPPMPYYLATDLWRINALKEMDVTEGENVDTATEARVTLKTQDLKKRHMENLTKEESRNLNGNADYEENAQESETQAAKTYDTQNLTKDWWYFREQYQGIGSPDGGLYEDYLQDLKIVWNKPYLRALLRKGKSKTWESLLEETFNITEISAKPLLNYFKPLEEILNDRIKIKNYTQLFNFDDFDFMSQSYALNPTDNEEGEKPAEGSDALFFSLAVIAAAGVVTIIVTIGRRRYKRRQRARERKRRLAEF